MTSAIDAKQVRVRCPTCYHPERITATICATCGARLDPRRQWEVYEQGETRTQ